MKKILASIMVAMSLGLFVSSALAAGSCGKGHVKVFANERDSSGNWWLLFSLDNALGAAPPSGQLHWKDGVGYSVVKLTVDSTLAIYHFDAVWRSIHTAFLSGAAISIWNKSSERTCKDMRPSDMEIYVCAADGVAPCAS